MIAHDHYEELIAAYALDALPADDRRDLESHLVGCSACQSTLADLRRVSASLGMAVEPIAPPAALRARTLARAVRAAPVAESTMTERRVPRAAPSGRQSWWAAPWAMAASLVAVAGLMVYAMSLRAQLDSTRGMLAEALERVETLRRDVAEARSDSARLTNTLNVVQSGDVLRVDLRGAGPASGASGRAYVSLSRGLVFTAERLPELAPSRSYQLWVIPQGGAPVSAGVFTVNQAGNSFISSDLPAEIGVVAAVAVTEEPAGGSPKPTTSPLLQGQPVNN